MTAHVTQTDSRKLSSEPTVSGDNGSDGVTFRTDGRCFESDAVSRPHVGPEVEANGRVDRSAVRAVAGLCVLADVGRTDA